MKKGLRHVGVKSRRFRNPVFRARKSCRPKRGSPEVRGAGSDSDAPGARPDRSEKVIGTDQAG